MSNEWDSLNERQQTYMRAIFKQDQAQEQYERQRAARDWRSRPADKWRWIEYGDAFSGYTPLKQAIKDAKMVDPGTGSTFRALAERGYILADGNYIDGTVNIRLTTKGRKLVRQSLNITSTHQKLPTGSLQEWHWRALVCVYQTQGADPVTFPRGIGDSTVHRLEYYTVKGVSKPLIAYIELPCEPWIAQDWHYRPYTRTSRNVLRLTPFGQQYYRENWQRYREMYPDVDAPEPVKVEENDDK